MAYTEYEEIDALATIICDMVKNKDQKLKRAWADKDQMLMWYEGKYRNQVREVHLDEEHVSNIVYRIEASGHSDNANPILCYEEIIDSETVLIVADGNNTNAALLRADKKGYISIEGTDVLIIPEDLIPNDVVGKKLLLDAIGAEMNVSTVIKKGMMPRDLRAMVKRHKEAGVDIDDKAYRAMLRRKFQMTAEDVSSNVSKAKSEQSRELKNDLHNFHQYTTGDGDYFKRARTIRFNKENRSVGVCWAVVDRCKWIPETLGKAMGLSMNHAEIHIVFHFKDFEDTSFQSQAETYIASFSKKYGVAFSYEFLPWKQGEAEV